MTRQERGLVPTDPAKLAPSRKVVALPILKDIDGNPAMIEIKRVSLLVLSSYLKGLPGPTPKPTDEEKQALDEAPIEDKLERLKQYFEVGHQVIAIGCRNPRFYLSDGDAPDGFVSVDVLFEEDKMFLFEEILNLSGYFIDKEAEKGTDKEGQHDAVTFPDGRSRPRRAGGKRTRKGRDVDGSQPARGAA
jgi:hypothetical protein